jgi:1,4-dihydroxy-2-naphthoate polyprenyltransferase
MDKSVITCDMEGRIETFNEGAVEIFGYQPEEVIGKKRVSLFSPGQIVLQNVPSWLKTASQQGLYESKTVFLRRDGTPFPAHIRITPTFKNNVQIGYCGVTEVIPDVDPAEIAPNIKTSTKIFSWLVITRAPFLTAIIIPILIGAAWVAYQKLVNPFPWSLFWLTLFAGIFMHIAANTFNDYFDWTSGTDQLNNDYFTPYTGGSRSIELGLIDPKNLFRVALSSLIISTLLGLALTYLSGIGVLIFGLFGAITTYFYTAPPLRLAARRGLGELVVFLNFGPLAVAGSIYAMTGRVTLIDFLVGIPIGLLTTAILWVNQLPDETSDRLAKKINLVVLLGKKRARWGYVALMVLTFGLILYWLITGAFPLGAALALGSIPLAWKASLTVMRDYDKRSLSRASAATIQVQLVAGLLLAVGLVISSLFI